MDSQTTDEQAASIPDVKPENNTVTQGTISPQVKQSLIADINNMLAFAAFNGETVNTEIINLIQQDSIDNLINAHNLLAKDVAPATPKSIAYTRQLYKDGKNESIFKKLPLVRNLILLALFFLATFIITGMSPDVDNDSLDKGVLSNEGIPLLINLLFLASISGLGVLFYLLKSLSTAVRNGTLVPEDTIYYIALIVLGIIAGLIMSEIISFYTSDPEGINLFNKSVLALIGGFSSDAIFSVLQSLIERIKAIFSPTATR